MSRAQVPLPSAAQLVSIALHARRMEWGQRPWRQPDVLWVTVMGGDRPLGAFCAFSGSLSCWEGWRQRPPRSFLLPDRRELQVGRPLPLSPSEAQLSPGGWLRSGSGGGASQVAVYPSRAPASCTACPHN